MQLTEQTIRVMKDGEVLETITVTRKIEHKGVPILMYKYIVDEDSYLTKDYDVLVSGEIGATKGEPLKPKRIEY